MFNPSHSPGTDQIAQLLKALPGALVLVDDTQAISYMNPEARMLTGLRENHEHVTLDALRETVHLKIEKLPVDLEGLHIYRLVAGNARHDESENSGYESAQQMPRLLRLFDAHPAHILGLFDTLGVGLVVLDDAFHIDALNQAAVNLLGYSEAIARERPVTRIIPDIDPRQLQAFRDSPEQHPAPWMLTQGDKSLAVQLVQIGTAGADGSLLLVLFDLTPYLSHNLKQSPLLRIIVHDLTNPLNIALNFAEMLDKGELEEGEVTEVVPIMLTQLRRMRDLLRDLSLLDQIGDRIRESFEEVHLDILVAMVINDLETRAAEARVRLLLMPLPETSCVVYGNERLLRQAIQNLVENAIKYTLPDGWVRVTLRQKGPWFDVLVADNGIGIPPAKQAAVFAPFYRVRDNRTSNVKGTGLGLHLVRSIVEQHDGKLWFHSVPDKGSIFVLRLRAYDGSDKKPQDAAPES